MKTKYVLSALCLPALFAACSQEEFVTEDNGLGNRETVNLTLAANYGAEDNANTRMVNQNGSFLWDGTDALGATWLNGNSDIIYSNNKFVNGLTAPSASANFTTQSTTVVGKYLFYYPYSTKMTSDLQGVQYSLPEPQEYDPNGDKMMENNFMISPRITVDGKEPGGLTLPLTLRSIYGYGLLNLKLADNLAVGGAAVSSVNIQKVIITYTSNVEKSGMIDMSAVPEVDLRANSLRALRETENGTYYGKSDAEITSGLLSAADKTLTAKADAYTGGSILDLTTCLSGETSNKIGQVSISCISDETPNGVALAQGGEFSTRVLLPTTADAGVSDLEIKVYTDKGVCTVVTLGTARIKPSHTINLANINRDGSVSSFTIGNLLPAAGVNAISEKDFIASMSQYVGQPATNVNVQVGNFDLTPRAIAAIPSNVSVIFTSGANFNGNMTLERTTFSASQTYNINGGTVNLKGVTTDATATIKVKKGATAVATPNANGKYVVEGTLNVANYDTNGDAATTTINSIVVNKDKSASVVNVNTPVTATTFTVTKGKVVNNSTINTISVRADGKLENKGTVTTVSRNDGTIENDGTLTTVTLNNKTIKQTTANSIIGSCTTNETTGKIETVAYSRTTVATNNGEVVYVDNARVAVTSNTGDVTYAAPATIKATDFTNLSAAVTKIKFASDFTYNYINNGTTDESNLAALPTNVTKLVFAGNLTLGQNWSMPYVTSISFIGATANITGKKTITGNALTFTLSAGVAESTAGAGDNVATDLYIGPSTKITELTANPTLLGGARVWNDGVVEGKSGVVGGPAWSGKAIE